MHANTPLIPRPAWSWWWRCCACSCSYDARAALQWWSSWGLLPHLPPGSTSLKISSQICQVSLRNLQVKSIKSPSGIYKSNLSSILQEYTSQIYQGSFRNLQVKSIKDPSGIYKSNLSRILQESANPIFQMAFRNLQVKSIKSSSGTYKSNLSSPPSGIYQNLPK